MSKTEILEELNKLPTIERLRIIEAALQSLYKDFQHKSELAPLGEAFEFNQAAKNQMEAAAKALLGDYTADPELTSFTVLDSEDFRAQR
jgi:hypothetical protein